ncbi:MAG: protein translocase subunit preprotein translocase subunit SecA [Candidatus Peregrinibacteria bacterium GW2011_GWE2_39_6]|nr:MAG: protein translocase subunit preprotein translocase subunit SecA [Candidatus Peregrinibacteria bacterium GW2011_GWE2_39_6]
MLTKLLNKIIGDPNEKELHKLQPLVEEVNQIEKDYQTSLPPSDIPQKTAEFKQRFKDGQSLDDLLPEAFALAKYACRVLIGEKWLVRGKEITWEMIPYDVQLIGGMVLHQGKIAEMKTGEGKTLVCTLPIYLNSLTGKGVHLVTVNEYLAHRDAEWMSGLFNKLGLSIGVIAYGQSPAEKKAAYDADVTYGTNNEFGFDYLRDNMARQAQHRVQRKLNYAIVDEVDSILIDEARTPLIISAPAEESTSKYQKYAQLVGQLQENTHYNIDEKAKTAVLSEEGIAKMEQLLGVENIYTEAGFEEVHHIEQALKALTVYKLDVDYMVKDGEVIIVDEFTGRLMEGRRYSQGLHQAIEAKEGVEIKRESKTLATITFQNYFRLFEKLAGMTGTAITEAEEFASIYGLETLIIPTHKSVVRQDLADGIYKNTKGKIMSIVTKVKELHEKGQPVLIGTISVEKSELLSKLLSVQGIKHNVLNAKYHEREAEIIAQAGQKGAVTIATNMAGRGTDIKLGEGVVEVGGLYVIGTERHESRRIDNQLRGRSGRQGDPGASQFYVSMEDDLMRLFGSDRVRGVMERLGVPEDTPIESKFISRSIESAQKRVEGHHFDIRKHLVEYDNVMNRHREIMYRKRTDILEKEVITEHILEMLNDEANSIVMSHASLEDKDKWNYKDIGAPEYDCKASYEYRT